MQDQPAANSWTARRTLFVAAYAVIFGALAFWAFRSGHAVMAIAILVLLPTSIASGLRAAARRAQQRGAPGPEANLREAEAFSAGARRFLLRLGGTALRSVLIFIALCILVYGMNSFVGLRTLGVVFLLMSIVFCFLIYPPIRLFGLYARDRD